MKYIVHTRKDGKRHLRAEASTFENAQKMAEALHRTKKFVVLIEIRNED